MKKRIFRYLKHTLATLLFLVVSVVLFGLYHGASMHYGDNPLMMDWENDGPYVFYKNDSILNINYIKGNQNDGFFLEQKEFSVNSTVQAFSHFALDDTSFEFSINTAVKSPPHTYDDDNEILAISDIESGYKTFRDFLINSQVIDKNLNWIFGTGHLVLVGDFVDRGFSTTQVLWFIYKLEQDAKKNGGFVHFILGNHELKNLQGNYESSSPKYVHIASILEKKQHQLYDSNSFIGKWMASKNTIERINGILFTHGGIHPDVIRYNLDIDKMNEITRENYYKAFYPKPEKTKEQFLNSTNTGVAWYRGYFKDNLSQVDIELVLEKLNAKSIVVGHTLQSKVNRKYNGRVIGIDVQHPKDYHKNFPNRKSEGLYIANDNYYRVLHNGKKVKI